MFLLLYNINDFVKLLIVYYLFYIIESSCVLLADFISASSFIICAFGLLIINIILFNQHYNALESENIGNETNQVCVVVNNFVPILKELAYLNYMCITYVLHVYL